VPDLEKPQLNMRRIVEHHVTHLAPGMEVARDVQTPDGKVLVAAGTILNRPTVEKLNKWVDSKVPIFAEAPVNPLGDPKVKRFLHNYQTSVHAVERAFDLIRSEGELPMAAFEKTSAGIAKDVIAVGNALDQIYSLPTCDDYTFRHCVNVSVISAMIAMWLKYPVDIINSISLAGLMHDVGKAELPPELLNRPYKLPPLEYEIYQQHTQLGAELVRKQPGIAESILAGVLQHHEREDGSGYPDGLVAADIHPYAKIVAIADLYDEALTIDLNPELVVSPYTSLERLWDRITTVDAKACVTFVGNMTNFLSGNVVMLTDGRQARVVYINKDWPSRSIVQLESGEVLDLMEHNCTARIRHLVR
jgi:putative nucleotidyltransferase with HDIG domain